MKSMNKKNVTSERGSVMMEYIVLNLCFFVVLALAAHFCFPDFTDKAVYQLDNSGNVQFEEDKNTRSGAYGRLGTAFVQHYNMMLNLVSMPYP